MDNDVTEAGNFAGRQRKLQHEMTQHIFPPIPSKKVETLPEGLKHHHGEYCCCKKRAYSRGGSLSSGSLRSGSLSSCSSERSYSSSYCSSCSCSACGSPTHFCSYCRCRCYSPTSLPAAGCSSNKAVGDMAPLRPQRCTSSAPVCCCSHGKAPQGTRRAHFHIPESIAEEEGMGEGEKEGGGAAVGRHGRKRKGRKGRGNECVNLPRIHTGKHFMDWHIPKDIAESCGLHQPLPPPPTRKGISPMHGLEKHSWVNKLTEKGKGSLQLAPHQKPPIKEYPCPHASNLREMFKKYFTKKYPSDYTAMMLASASPSGRKIPPTSPKALHSNFKIPGSTHPPKTTPPPPPLELKSLPLNHEDYFRQRYNRDNMPGPMFTQCPREGLWFVVHPDFRCEPGMRGGV